MNRFKQLRIIWFLADQIYLCLSKQGPRWTWTEWDGHKMWIWTGGTQDLICAFQTCGGQSSVTKGLQIWSPVLFLSTWILKLNFDFHVITNPVTCVNTLSLSHTDQTDSEKGKRSLFIPFHTLPNKTTAQTANETAAVCWKTVQHSFHRPWSIWATFKQSTKGREKKT